MFELNFIFQTNRASDGFIICQQKFTIKTGAQTMVATWPNLFTLHQCTFHLRGGDAVGRWTCD